MSILTKLFGKTGGGSIRVFETDFCAWLSRISASESPDPQVIAFNIGIFESESGFQAYLCGSTHYSEDDSDWACEEAFTPSERYFPIPAEFASGKGWLEIQSAVVSAANSFFTSSDSRNSFLANAKVVTAGFDDGDLIRIA